MPSVLITDDSGTARMVIQRCLEVTGCAACEFIHASNGQEAIEILRARKIDLLITDMNMPVMDGRRLLLSVKASPRLNHVPVVVVTSIGNPALERELFRIGVNTLIHKPVSPEKIAACIEDIFGIVDEEE
jgi:two-component system, chemotaxis family, chemotaxis protein CheY